MKLFLLFAMYNAYITSVNSWEKYQERNMLKHNLRRNCSISVPCDCFIDQNDIMIVDCADRNLKTIPKLPSNTQILYLQKNNIQFLTPVHLKELQHLLFLDLSWNNLDYMDFQENLFQYNKKIRYLNIKENNALVTDIPRKYPLCISNLISLEKLEIDGVNENGFPSQFLQLNSLYSLTLSSSVCNIPTVKLHFFKNVPNVKHLSIAYCNILSTELGAFQILSNLETLNISYNDKATFAILKNVTTDLTQTQIKKLDISKLHCTYGVGTFLTYEDAIALSKTNISHLYLNENRLAIFEPNLLKGMPLTLRYASAKDNHFTLSASLFEFSTMSWEEIDISYQFTSHFPKASMTSMDCYDWRAPPMVHQQIDFTDIIDKIKKPFFPLPPNLKNVNMANMKLFYDILPKVTFQKNVLERVEMQNNVFRHLIGPIQNAHNLKFLNLSGCSCEYISAMFFEQTHRLEILLMANNLLGHSFKGDRRGEIFGNLKNLKELDISNNRIDILPKQLLIHQYNIKKLLLNNNSISLFDLKIKHMSKIQLLDLSFNKIRTFDSRKRAELSRMSNHLKVNLTGNLLACTCTNRDFLKWFYKKKSLFVSVDSYLCSLPNGENKNLKNVLSILEQLENECRKNDLRLILPLCLGIPIILIFIASVVAYNFWFKIVYMYYSFITRNESQTAIIGENFSHDLYLFYADTDQDMAVSITEKLEEIEIRRDTQDEIEFGMSDDDIHLTPNGLESNNRFNVYVDYRDAAHLSGHSSLKILYDGVNRSKKIAVLLTKDMGISTNKSMLKALLTFVHQEKERSPLLIVIFCEGCDFSIIPSNLIDKGTKLLMYRDEKGFYKMLVNLVMKDTI